MKKISMLESFKGLLNPPRNIIPGLDVLRSLAILLVIADHFVYEYERNLGETNLKKIPFFYFGWAGVDLFFILSGYLIGRSLLNEIKTHGSIKVLPFLLRRGLRIWPLYLFYIIVLLSGILLGIRNGTIINSVYDIFFISNYIKGIVSGGWSISTEEQFYIFLPLLLLIVRNRVPFKYFWVVPTFFLLAFPIVRLITLTSWFRSGGHYPLPENLLYTPLHNHADGLAFGVILAWFSLAVPKLLEKRHLLQNLMLPGILIATGILLRQLNKDVFAFSSLAFVFGGMALFFIRDETPFNQILHKSRITHIVSKLSYGMYLNHFYILPLVVPAASTFVFTTTHSHSLAFFTSYATVFLVSLGVSFFTFTLVERPFLVLRGEILPHRQDNLKSKIKLLR